jgi:hypothetical protein
LQVAYLNRAHAKNFFLTTTEPDLDTASGSPGRRDATYEECFQSLISGCAPAWLQPNNWVYMLCDAFTLTEAHADVSCQTAFRELHVETSSQFSLVRWCHRIGHDLLKTDLHAAKTNTKDRAKMDAAVHAVDCLTALFGCDRLVWARKGEVQGPPGIHQIREGVQKQLKTVSKDPDDRAHVQAAIKKLDNAYSQRFRADDAFAGRAYCQIQALDVQACPVAVMPAFGCARQSDPWIPACRGSGRLPPGLDTFGSTQGNKLSHYSQLRLNLFARAVAEDV